MIDLLLASIPIEVQPKEKIFFGTANFWFAISILSILLNVGFLLGWIKTAKKV